MRECSTNATSQPVEGTSLGGQYDYSTLKVVFLAIYQVLALWPQVARRGN